MELTEPARERFFGDLARRVGADLPSGEAFRHWRERIVSDSTVRLGGEQRPSPEGPPPSFVSFRDTWVQRFRALFQQWRVDVPVESGANAYSDFHASAIAYRDVPLALVTLGRRHRPR